MKKQNNNQTFPDIGVDPPSFQIDMSKFGVLEDGDVPDEPTMKVDKDNNSLLLKKIKQQFSEGATWEKLSSLSGMSVPEVQELISRYGWIRDSEVLINAAVGFEIALPNGKEGSTKTKVTLQNLSMVDFSLSTLIILMNAMRSEIQTQLLSGPNFKFECQKFGVKSIKDFTSAMCQLIDRREALVGKLPDIDSGNDFFAKMKKVIAKIDKNGPEYIEGFQRSVPQPVEYSGKAESTAEDLGTILANKERRDFVSGGQENLII